MATAHNRDDFDKSSHWLWWGRSSRSWHLLSSLLNRRCDTRFLKRSHCIVMSNIIIPFCYIFPLSLYSFSISMNEFFIIRVTADVATLIRFIYQRLFLRVHTFCIWSYDTVTLDSFIYRIYTLKIRKFSSSCVPAFGFEKSAGGALSSYRVAVPNNNHNNN